MTESDPLLTMMVGGIVAAFALGLMAHWLRLSPIVGYLLAGVLIGHYAPSFAFDFDLASEFAQIGVVLIMFGMGLKFSPAKLIACRWLALPCALGQMAAVTLLGFGFSALLPIPLVEALILGFALSIASTIVLLRTFEERRLSGTPAAHLAMCWLIVQDLAAVFVMVLMPALAQQGQSAAGGSGILHTAGSKAIELTLFAVIMIIAGRRILPGLLVFIAKARSRELFSLGIFAIILGIAFAAQKVFGTTFALGAFVAGLVLNELELSHRAAEDLTPLRDAFAVLFFVSVGMLFDPQIVLTQSWTILAVLAVIIAGNGGAAFLMMMVMRVPLDQRLIVATGLAQIGEFSFLIGGFGLTLGLISDETQDLITAGALLTIALNPPIRQLTQFVARRTGIGRAPDVAERA